MCHQSVGLVQSVIERAGIPTVSITLLREVTERVRPPRALFVDRPLGFPLGEPHNGLLQKAITMSALALLSEPVEDFLVREMVEGPVTPPAGRSDR
jgi:D-proline reductase (dithiol) PrdB